MLVEINSNFRLEDSRIPLAKAEPPRILVAEDDRHMRKLIVRALEKDGYQVAEAAGGTEALVRIADAIDERGLRYYDLLVSDIRMPGPSGMEILASLRKSDWSVPVILITAFGDADTHMEARQLGAVAVLDKPFNIDELRWIVGQLLPVDE